MSNKLDDSALFTHNGLRGTHREQIIEEFLRPFLPQCYGISSGQIFSTDGTASHQIDVVVYDAIFSNVLFQDHENSLFTAESVYGTIEVKSNLSTSELTRAIENIVSVKTLAREASHAGDILPTRRFEVKGPLTLSCSKRNEYFGIVFAYDGTSGERLTECLNEMSKRVSILGSNFQMLSSVTRDNGP